MNVKLTTAQREALLALGRDPNASVGSCTNMTMCALEKKGDELERERKKFIDDFRRAAQQGETK